MTDEQKNVLLTLGVSYDEAVARCLGNEDFLIKFLKLFSKEACYSNLVNAMEEDNIVEAFKQAHTLKGVAGNVCLTGLSKTTSELVEILRNKESLTDEEMVLAKEKYNSVKTEYEKAKAFIDSLY